MSNNVLKVFYRNFSSKTESLSNLSLLAKPARKKFTVVRRSFPSKNEPPVILEQKDASHIIKRINFEFSQLYGPVQSPKYANPKYNIKRSTDIIQNQTYIPISENYKVLPSLIDNNENKNLISFSTDLGSILSFPLVNKSVLFEQSNEIIISKMNALKDLLDSKSDSQYPSISKILQSSMSKESIENLKRWEEKMIAEMGIEAFKKHKSDLLENGISLHSNINEYLTSVPEKDLAIRDANKGHWKSLRAVFPLIEDVKLLEERLCHPFLCYKGVIDCFAKYRGHLVAIDWKTSKKKKYNLSSTFDNPLQLAAYVGALNFDPKFQYMVTKGLIVVAYENGDPATAHFMDESTVLRYWQEWLHRVKMYWEMEDQKKIVKS